MAEIANFETNWDSHTGEEVQSFIKTKLKSAEDTLTTHTSEISNSMKDITFKVDEDNGNLVHVTKSFNGKADETATFQLVAVSSYTATLTISEDSLYLAIKQGNDLSISYSWEVRNGTTKVAGIKADITATITCGSQSSQYKVSEKSVATVRTTTDNVGSITIPSSKLFEGYNNISIGFVATGGDGGRIETAANITADILNPKLVCSMASAKSYNYMRDADNDQFTINFQVTNSKGAALTLLGKTISATKCIYYRGFENYKIDGITASSYTNTFSGLVQTATGATTALSKGAQRMFIEAYVPVTVGGQTIKIYSNMIMFSMFCGNNDTENYIQFATMQDVPDKNTGDVTIEVGQYDSKEFKVYAYANSAQTLQYIYNDNGTETVLSYKDIAANTITDVTYSYIFRSLNSNQKFTFKGEGGQLGFKISVDSINSSIAELTSQVVKLSASGKSQSDHNWASNGHVTTFSGFDWNGNGWIDDALRVNNGANAVIDYAPCSNAEFTVCIRYQAPNGIYKTSSGGSEALISCMSNNTGFVIYPEKAELYNKGVGISTEYNSDEIHDITFVRYGSDYQYLMEIFVDGVSQCVCQVDEADIITHNTPITLTASHTQLNVYNIDIFDQGMSFTNIQSLFCFHKSNSSDIIDYIEDNNIFGSAVTTSPGDHGQDITIDNLPVGSIYMLIKAFGEEDSTPWATIDNYPGTDAETYKGIRHIVGNTLIIQKTADGSAHARNVCFDRGTISAQGTSSMAYPVKNFRFYTEKTIDESCPYYNSTAVTKYKKAGAGDLGLSNVMVTGCDPDLVITNSGSSYTLPDTYTGKLTKCKDGSGTKCKYALYSKSYGDSYESAPAKLWCLKADYAESSGSHNTGFARMANFALTSSSNICSDREASQLTPPQQSVIDMGSDAEYTNDIRTTVDGYPVYLFFEDAQGNQVYHGKYNINNEKKSENVFGFVDITDYQNNSVVQAEGDNLKSIFNDTAGYLKSTHETFEVNDKEYLNPVECWEFSNNTFTVSPQDQNVIGAFQYPYTEDSSYPKYSTYPGLNPFTVKDNEGNLAWLSQAWEYRYPDFDSTDTANILYTEGTCKPFILNSIYKWLYKHSYPLTGDMNTLNEFCQELHLYFNVNSLLKYFILTKWFGAVDQRIKNCMLAIWCDPKAINNTNSEYPTGHMRAYYIFYDNDTILGVDNAGSLTQDWDIDEDVYPGHGKHAIWDNLEACYQAYVNGDTSYGDVYDMGELVESAYASLRSVLSDANIEKYLFTDQEDRFPDAVHNVDAEVKYFYIKTINPGHETQPDGLSKFQGNRKWHRKRWLKKRTAWMDAKFRAGNYTEYSYKFKVGGTAGSSSTLEGGNIKLTSALKDWRFFVTNTTGQVLAQSSKLIGVNEESTLTIAKNSFSISDFVSIGALYGCKKIDLSDFKVTTWFEDLQAGGNVLPYVEEFVLNNTDSAVKKFTQSSLPNLLQYGGQILFPNLVKLSMCNAQIKSDSSSARFATLDLSKFYNLETIDARGTDVDLKLPNSSNLKYLYIQSPIEFSIANKPNLSTLSIADKSKLTTLTVGAGNNEYVYNQAFSLISDNIEKEGFTATLTMGTSDSYYAITDDQVATLLTLGAGGYSNLTVKGYIVNTNITPQDASSLTDYFGDDLHVSTSISSDLTFTPTADALNEGSTLKILLNNNLASKDDWSFSIDGVEDNDLDGSIIVTKNTSYIEFSATALTTNTSAEHSLTVKATYGGQEFEYDKTIPIQYIKITGAYVTAEKDILLGGGTTKLTVSYIPQTNTKSEWVKDKLTWVCEHGSVNSSNIYTMDLSNTSDDTINLSIPGISNINTIYITYDKLLYSSHTVDELKEGGSDRWVYLILQSVVGEVSMADYANGIYVSTLHNSKFQLDTSWYSKVSGAATVSDSDGNSTQVELDFTNLKYFRYPFAAFTIPNNVRFTTFNVPESSDITTVTGTITADGWYGYETITYPESMIKGSLKINTNSLLPSLLLDLSKTSITKVYNSGDADVDNNSFSVQYTLSTQSFSPASSSLFVFPSTLETLGNYLETDETSYPLAIFNLNDISIRSSTPNHNQGFIMYPIQAISKNINLGALYGYNAAESGTNASISQSASTIKNTYYTHYDGNIMPVGTNGIYTYSNIERIGACTFDDESTDDAFKNVTIQINSQVTQIGYSAFKQFKGIIQSTVTETIGSITAQKFTGLTTIGDYAFAYLPSSFNIYLTNITSIGDKAFTRAQNSGFVHNIYINQSSNFVLSSDEAFGSDSSNPTLVYMTTSLYNSMYSASNNFKSAVDNGYITVNKITF